MPVQCRWARRGGTGLRLFARHDQDRHTAGLFGPLVLMALGGVALFIALAVLLLFQFDNAAAQREQHMVINGLKRQFHEFDAVIVPQVNWDQAVKALDNKFDPDWTDFNFGNYLYTFNGFTRGFVVDGAGQPIYASVDGERADIAAYAPFAGIASQLLPQIRAQEAKRPPFKVRPGKNNILTEPIQAEGLTRVNGEVFVVIATLVQPDFGHILPRSATAPVTISALPINAAMLKAFEERYLLDDLKLVDKDQKVSGRAWLMLRSPSGEDLGALTWKPRAPGAQLLETLRIPILIVLVLIACVAWLIVRRGTRVLNELVTSEARARHLAYHDPLTRLPNRAMLFERLRALLGELDRSGECLAVMCVDLDRFKEVNDTLGHQAGDQLIEVVANRLRVVCSGTALISRLGGDEFVVLTKVHGPAEAEALAVRIIKSVSDPVQSEYGKIEAACSIGIALVDQGGVDASEALRWADLALYRSKAMGRSRSSFFELAMDTALQSRRSLEADLGEALARGELSMVYQPQVDRNGKIAALEALVRWTHAERGEVPPGIFIPLAEETGLILKLGELVLRRVFAETGTWRSVRIAINVSPVQMRTPGFAELVIRLIAQAGIDPTRYEFELTETALLGEDPVTMANIDELKRIGLSIALDDFGTGYSSLSVLQRFAVDRIKIDRTFVGCLGDGEESGLLVDAILKLARALNLAVIAEGVETPQQMDWLAQRGCREFQGHLIGLPLPARGAAELIGETYEARLVRLSQRR